VSKGTGTSVAGTLFTGKRGYGRSPGHGTEEKNRGSPTASVDGKKKAPPRTGKKKGKKKKNVKMAKKKGESVLFCQRRKTVEPEREAP